MYAAREIELHTFLASKLIEMSFHQQIPSLHHRKHNLLYPMDDRLGESQS
jgi:hypothetical protein